MKDGRGQIRLTSNPAPADVGPPVWSPDGQKIGFRGSRDGHDFEIYVVDADGSDSQLSNTDRREVTESENRCPPVRNGTLTPL
jgi:Tol biopolymer transport system component